MTLVLEAQTESLPVSKALLLILFSSCYLQVLHTCPLLRCGVSLLGLGKQERHDDSTFSTTSIARYMRWDHSGSSSASSLALALS